MLRATFLSSHVGSQLAEKAGKTNDSNHQSCRDQNGPQHMNDVILWGAVVEDTVANVIAELGRAGQKSHTKVEQDSGEPDHHNTK